MPPKAKAKTQEPKKEEPKPEPAKEEVPEVVEPLPPNPDEDTSLTTGLELPLRPVDVDQVWAARGGFEEQGRLLEAFFHLKQQFPAPAQREIICDFHLYNLTHAKSICFSARQAAVFVAIMARIMDMTRKVKANAPRGEDHISALQCFKEFERLVLKHSVDDPPRRLQVFRGSEARMLTDFASQSFFKHFLLYQFCSNHEQEEQALRFHVGLDRPLQAPDLNLARLQRRSRKPEPGAEPGAEAQGDAQQGTAGEEEAHDEIERLVQEKLRETESKMQAQLDDREELFTKMLKSRTPEPAPKGKAKR